MVAGPQRASASTMTTTALKQDLGNNQTAGPVSATTTNSRGGGGEDDAVMMLEVSNDKR